MIETRITGTVVNKIKKSKENSREVIIPLPLFMLTFQIMEDIKKIDEILSYKSQNQTSGIINESFSWET